MSSLSEEYQGLKQSVCNYTTKDQTKRMKRRDNKTEMKQKTKDKLLNYFFCNGNNNEEFLCNHSSKLFRVLENIKTPVS